MKRLVAVLLVLASISDAFAQESGYQTINGTRVFTQIDHARGIATFSNDCGSQTLSQSELQGGAIPSNIIPCPRPSGRSEQRCADGYEPTGSGRCKPIGAFECGPGYCVAGQVCSKDEQKCLRASDARVCNDGQRYCRNGEICFTSNQDEATCIDEDSDRLCKRSDGKQSEYCSPGLVCVNEPGGERNKCVRTSNRYSHKDKEDKFFLTVSQRGTFFGLGRSRNGNDAKAENDADTICNIQKSLTASISEERIEFCNQKASGTCVAYAKGRAFVYRDKPVKEEAVYSGVGSGDTEEEATANALHECKIYARDAVCNIVPESVACTNRR